MSMTAQPREPTGGSGVKAPKFSYVRAESLDEVLRLLDEHGDEARILAGGQNLMPTLNMRLSQPRLLIDINRLEALKGIAVQGDKVRIGALTRHAEAAGSEIVAKHLPLIAEAMPHVAHVAVRNRGTFGGSIALADPAAEMPACVLALGATLVVQSAGGKREIAADVYFKGLYETARQANDSGRGSRSGPAPECRIDFHGARPPPRRFRDRRHCGPLDLRPGPRDGGPPRLFRQRRQADACGPGRWPPCG